MIYFSRKGKLPWDSDPPTFEAIDPKDPLGYKKILANEKSYDKFKKETLKVKKLTSVAQLCLGLPKILTYLLDYALNLKFE